MQINALVAIKLIILLKKNVFILRKFGIWINSLSLGYRFKNLSIQIIVILTFEFRVTQFIQNNHLS